ncbi:MAG: hypothetical protein ACM3KF_00110 [Acidobacteriota bacterium]
MTTLQEMVDELAGSDDISSMVHRIALSGLQLERRTHVPRSKMEEMSFLTMIARFVVTLLDFDANAGVLPDSEHRLARTKMRVWLRRHDIDPGKAGL